jgi:hypothetical protein
MMRVRTIAVGQVQRPLPAGPPVSDRVATALHNHWHQRENCAGERPVNGWIHSGRAAEIT